MTNPNDTTARDKAAEAYMLKAVLRPAHMQARVEHDAFKAGWDAALEHVRPGLAALEVLREQERDQLLAELAECLQKNVKLNEANHALAGDTVELERQLSIARRPNTLAMNVLTSERDAARAELAETKERLRQADAFIKLGVTK